MKILNELELEALMDKRIRKLNTIGLPVPSKKILISQVKMEHGQYKWQQVKNRDPCGHGHKLCNAYYHFKLKGLDPDHACWRVNGKWIINDPRLLQKQELKTK